MPWFKPEPKPPEPLFDVYCFAPKPDITTFELATIVQRCSTVPDGSPTGWTVATNAESPLPTTAEVARHFTLFARGVTHEQVLMVRHSRPAVL